MVINIAPTAIDGSPSLSFTFGQSCFDQSVDDANALVQPSGVKCDAGNVGKDLLQLGIGEVLDFGSEQNGRRLQRFV